MESKKLVKFESELIKLGFKKIWFSDKSGYWFERKSKMKDLKLMFYVEPERNLFLLDFQTFQYYNKGLHKLDYETVAKFKCNLKTIKETIKKYK